MDWKIPIILATFIIIVGVFLFLFNNIQTLSNNDLNTTKITLFKSPYCGCCTNYVAYLKNNGFEVEVITIKDMESIKKKYNIASDVESCHTAVLGNYFIEGHVPIEAIKKLLIEKPNIDGIALPGMPAGSPGMPGIKEEPFVIYSIKNGKKEEFMIR